MLPGFLTFAHYSTTTTILYVLIKDILKTIISPKDLNRFGIYSGTLASQNKCRTLKKIDLLTSSKYVHNYNEKR